MNATPQHTASRRRRISSVLITGALSTRHGKLMTLICAIVGLSWIASATATVMYNSSRYRMLLNQGEFVFIRECEPLGFDSRGFGGFLNSHWRGGFGELPSISYYRLTNGQVWDFKSSRGQHRNDWIGRITVPLWMPFSCMVLVVLATSLRILRGRRLRAFPSCSTCKYPLIGNESGICPECGTRIN